MLGCSMGVQILFGVSMQIGVEFVPSDRGDLANNPKRKRLTSGRSF